MTGRNNLREARADSGWIAVLDLVVVEAAAPYERHPVVTVMGTASELADQPPLIALCLTTIAAGLFQGDARLTRAGVRMLTSHALATGLKSAVKNIVDRSRPAKVAEEGEHEFEPGDSTDGEDRSLPSGHTAEAVTVARAAVREYPAIARPVAVATLVAAGIQVPRKAHYPSDILVGALIGLCAEQAVHHTFQAVLRSRRRSRVGGHRWKADPAGQNRPPRADGDHTREFRYRAHAHG